MLCKIIIKTNMKNLEYYKTYFLFFVDILLSKNFLTIFAPYFYLFYYIKSRFFIQLQIKTYNITKNI